MIRQAYLIAMEEPALQLMTHGLPAAVLPLLDEPLAGLMLHLLRRHGVEKVTVITEDGRIGASLGDGNLYGLRVHYADGWPGAAENAYLVRGNILTDADLSALAERHKRSGAAITAAVRPGAPEDGLGMMALSAEAAASIPEGAAAEEIFPALAKCELAVTSCELAGYWCAVTDPESYRRAQMDLLSGRVGLPVRGRRQGSAIVAQGSQMPSDVRVTGRCYIGRFARIGHGAVLGPGTVIGRGAQVGGRAHIENACLMENAAVDGDSILRNVMVIPRAGNGMLQQMIPVSANVPRNGS